MADVFSPPRSGTADFTSRWNYSGRGAWSSVQLPVPRAENWSVRLMSQPATATTSSTKSFSGMEHPCPTFPVVDEPSWPNHLWHVALVCIFFFAPADLLLRRFLPDGKVRWFALHVLANAVITASALPDLIVVARSPLCAMLAPMGSWIPSHVSFAVHFYHLFAFTKLRTDDIIHHVLFGAPYGVVNFLFAVGPVVNALLFFATGLPGGITYALLVAVKCGLLAPIVEKQTTAALNTWLRAPGLVWVATVLASCATHGLLRTPPAAAAVCAILAFGNGVFYGASALESYVENRGPRSKGPVAAASDPE